MSRKNKHGHDKVQVVPTIAPRKLLRELAACKLPESKGGNANTRSAAQAKEQRKADNSLRRHHTPPQLWFPPRPPAQDIDGNVEMVDAPCTPQTPSETTTFHVPWFPPRPPGQDIDGNVVMTDAPWTPETPSVISTTDEFWTPVHPSVISEVEALWTPDVVMIDSPWTPAPSSPITSDAPWIPNISSWPNAFDIPQQPRYVDPFIP